MYKGSKRIGEHRRIWVGHSPTPTDDDVAELLVHREVQIEAVRHALDELERLLGIAAKDRKAMVYWLDGPRAIAFRLEIARHADQDQTLEAIGLIREEIGKHWPA